MKVFIFVKICVLNFHWIYDTKHFSYWSLLRVDSVGAENEISPF